MILRVAMILVGIPLGLYLAALWFEFWIDRSLAQWAAFGVGIPIALMILFAVMLEVKP